MEITIEKLSKTYEEVTAVDEVSFTVKQGELLALLGASGCGKTTLLRMISGLIQQTNGKIYLDGEDISDWPPQKRNTIMVFQNYALFPHLTVYENIAYGLKVRKLKREEIKRKIDAVIEKVRLEGLENRRIQALSGGQRQRVALARALVLEPNVLLFDEPLSNLDESLRVFMRNEIRRIQKEAHITAIYVTHDQREAMAIADKIAIMDKGKIHQIGTPDEIYFTPDNFVAADFMGHPNLSACSVYKEDGEAKFAYLGKTFKAPLGRSDVHVLIRPEEVQISDNDTEMPAVVVRSELMGPVRRYELNVNEQHLYVDALNRINVPHYTEGQKVYISF